jgi:ethanolamine ammonia-lyase small subunit
MKPPGHRDNAADLWARFRGATPARIGLGRSGDALTTDAVLDFQLAHAQARDAIDRGVDFAALAARIARQTLHVHSLAVDRPTFIRRPDLGRRLDPPSRDLLAAGRADPPWDVVFIVADGLSSAAIENHAAPFLAVVLPLASGWHVAPIILAEQARVALADEIGANLNARLAVILIGERPGLSVRDSLGIYLTFDPRPGRNDGERNCISNIHANGLSYQHAAEKLIWLMIESRRRQATGFLLKEDAGRIIGTGRSLPVETGSVPDAGSPKEGLLF